MLLLVPAGHMDRSMCHPILKCVISFVPFGPDPGVGVPPPEM